MALHHNKTEYQLYFIKFMHDVVTNKTKYIIIKGLSIAALTQIILNDVAHC